MYSTTTTFPRPRHSGVCNQVKVQVTCRTDGIRARTPPPTRSAAEAAASSPASVQRSSKRVALKAAHRRHHHRQKMNDKMVYIYIKDKRSGLIYMYQRNRRSDFMYHTHNCKTNSKKISPASRCTKIAQKCMQQMYSIGRSPAAKSDRAPACCR